MLRDHSFPLINWISADVMVFFQLVGELQMVFKV